MNKAELIVRVLDAVENHASPDNYNPDIKKFVDLIKSNYLIYRQTKDFQTAARNASIEVVEAILNE